MLSWVLSDCEFASYYIHRGIVQLDPDSPSFASAYWGAGERGGGILSRPNRLFKPLLFQRFAAAAAAALVSRTPVTDNMIAELQSVFCISRCWNAHVFISGILPQ